MPPFKQPLSMKRCHFTLRVLLPITAPLSLLAAPYWKPWILSPFVKASVPTTAEVSMARSMLK
jgi:hypothetical protein